MLPTAYQDDLTQDFTVARLPSKTFALNGGGMLDGLEALKQAVYLILNTERYAWLIFSWNYGVELEGLIGKPVEYCKLELERRISEALLQDDRVTAVQNFRFEVGGRKLLATFDVVSSFGTLQAQKEVTL